jgi:outer membrane receptor for ferrienterochelin and colicins
VKGLAALTTLLAMTFGTAVAAQDLPLADLELADLMKIEVQSVFGASKFLQKVTEAPASISIVTARDIAVYGYRTLAEIIRSAPGFNVTNDRNYSYVGVRGFQRLGDYNSRVLILIDGHRMNDPIYNQAYIGTEFGLDVELIDRVELIRGPSSSLYGTNAFFAVINVVTRKGAALRGVHVSGDVGSLRTGRGQAAFGVKFANGVDFLVSGSRYQSQGQSRLYFPEFDSPSTNNGVAEHLDTDATYRAYTSVSFKGLSFQGLYGRRVKRVPTAAFDTRFNDARFETHDAQGFADLRYARALAGWSLSSRLYYDRSEYSGRYPGNLSDTDGQPGPVFADYAHAGWWGTEVNLEKVIARRHKVTAGAEYRDNFRLDLGGFDLESGAVYLDDRRASHDAAVFVEDQYTIHDRLLLNAGIRTDRYQGFGSTTNPRLALIFRPAPKTAVKAMVGTAFRAPTNYELHYNSGDGLFISNPNLSPERIRTTEVVVERYFGERYRIMTSVYDSRVRDLISQVVTDESKLQFLNLDSAATRGIEAEVEAKWSTGIASRVAYSFQHATDSRTHLALVNSAKHLATVNLTVPLAGRQAFAGIDLHYVGPVETLTGTFTKGFAVPNLTLTTREFHDLTLSARVANLFDNRYGYPGGDEHRQNIIYQDGRTFQVGLTYLWRRGK